MYRVAKFLVKSAGGNFSEMADGLGVILLTWNARLYLRGSLDFESLQECLERNWTKLEAYNLRRITSLNSSDEQGVKEFFDDFLRATSCKVRKTGDIEQSPVSAAKALHMLAPNFFPIWDNAIARGYSCYWNNSSLKGADRYWEFMLKIKRIGEGLSGHYDDIRAISPESILKLIDEYNYSRFTKNWLRSESTV